MPADIRGRICAIQQSSIFIRVSIARLINEVKRVRLFAAFAARWPRARRAALRPAFELFFRRAQICLGHNQFVRLDTLQALGGFPTSGATEDSTLGYALGARGILIEAMPMVELTDLPETTREGDPPERALVPGRARRHRRSCASAGASAKSAFNFAQLMRHIGNKVIEWPIAALVYPLTGWLGLVPRLQYRAEHPVLFYLGVGAPTVSLAAHGVGGGHRHAERDRGAAPVSAARGGPAAQEPGRRSSSGTFRCQTYWLLATRAAWRVLWALWRTGRLRGGEDGSRHGAAVRAAGVRGAAAAGARGAGERALAG